MRTFCAVPVSQFDLESVGTKILIFIPHGDKLGALSFGTYSISWS